MKFILLFLLSIVAANSAIAQGTSRFEKADGFSERVIEFTEGQYIVNKGPSLLGNNWEWSRTPNLDFPNASGQIGGEYRSMTARFVFDGSAISTAPAAVHVIGMRGNFSVMLNDIELFRNYADVSDQMNPWYRPFLIPIPPDVLRSGSNEIRIHSVSRKIVGVGRVRLGAHADLQAFHDKRYFWHITAPTAMGFLLLITGSLVFCFWLARRAEIELLWLSLAAFLWFVRNHQYYVEALPFNFRLYSFITVSATYFATAAVLAFYVYFIKFPYRRAITIGLFAVGVAASVTFRLITRSSTTIYIPTMIVILVAAIFVTIQLTKQRDTEQNVVSLILLFVPFATFYDVIMLLRHSGDGTATYLAVFSVPMVTIAFALSFGKRTLSALTALGETNEILEKRISEVRAELSESEAAKQELLVSQALSSERERLMQEMHDGIGSNLTTALAVANRQSHSPNTIQVLKRALGDLKLTVDSLEPFEGDLVALLGNLRHRVARDLADAGVTCKWEVEDCQPLTWLDATNALHVLRIHSEAIGNVLAHSKATEIRIVCVESNHNGRNGISTYVADNGIGFDMKQDSGGKGLKNMKARAHSLHGTLNIFSKTGEGTKVHLWLPYDR